MSATAALLGAARRRRTLVLALTAVGTIVSALLCLRISFGTDVLTLLPESLPSLRAFRQYLQRFGAADQLYIVFQAPPGGSIEDADALVDAYVTRLRSAPEIGSIDAGLFDPGKDWSYLQDRTFALIGPAAARAALPRLDEAGMRQALLQSRDLLTAPSAEVRTLVQADPLGLLALLRDHFAGDRAFSSMNTAQRGYISPDGRSRLVIATPTGPPFDSAFCRRLFARLDAIEADARRATAPATAPDTGVRGTTAVSIQYAGGHRIAVETESIMKREATLNTVTSVAGILIFLLIVYRSPWLFLVSAIPMSVATVASVAINGLLRRQLSAAATGTSALLFGLGIDGLVLIYSRYLEEMESGKPAMDAIRGIAGAGTSMLLGSFTTAATFFGLTWIDLPGLQELGRLIGIGMLIGGPLTLVLVPALLPGKMKRPRGLSAAWLAPLIRRHRSAILAGAAVVTVAAIPMTSHLELDLRLQRLQPNTPAVRLQGEIAQQFGVDRDVAVALAQGPNLDELVNTEQRFTRALASGNPPLSVTGPAQLLPSAADQQATGRELAVLPPANVLQARFSTAAFDAGFRPGAFDAFAARLPRLLDPGQRLTYRGYVDHGLESLIARYVVPDATGFTTAAYAEINDAADLARARAAASAVGAPLTLTGVPVVNADLAAHFRPQFIIALVVGVVAVFLMMLFTFKRVSLTALALLPTVLGLVWAAALLAVCGVRLDLFSVFAVLTLIGIGVDYGIHLVHRVATEPGGLDLALARVVPSNLVAAVIALLGCGSLVTSTYPPLRSLGIVTVVGLCTCLATSVLVLPAMLIPFDRRTDRAA